MRTHSKRWAHKFGPSSSCGRKRDKSARGEKLITLFCSLLLLLPFDLICSLPAQTWSSTSARRKPGELRQSATKRLQLLRNKRDEKRPPRRINQRRVLLEAKGDLRSDKRLFLLRKLRQRKRLSKRGREKGGGRIKKEKKKASRHSLS